MRSRVENLLPIAGLAFGAGLTVFGAKTAIENGTGVAEAAQNVVSDSINTRNSSLVQQDKKDLTNDGGNLILGVLETAGGIAIVVKSAASVKE